MADEHPDRVHGHDLRQRNAVPAHFQHFAGRAEWVGVEQILEGTLCIHAGMRANPNRHTNISRLVLSKLDSLQPEFQGDRIASHAILDHTQFRAAAKGNVFGDLEIDLFVLRPE